MIIDSEVYITTPIHKYLENMLDTLGYQPIPLQLQPMIVYILSNTFLSMFGAIEKKLEMISWYIAHYDYDYRYELLYNVRHITAKLKTINDICGYLKNKANNIMKEANYKDKSYECIIYLFKDSILINYTNSDFLEFKNSYLQCNNNLENLYEHSLKCRHNIAHNINSVYRENLTFSELNKNGTLYNWYARFMILLLIDYALIDGFDCYNNRLSNIKWN